VDVYVVLPLVVGAAAGLLTSLLLVLPVELLFSVEALEELVVLPLPGLVEE
jgi:hypothetical protein